MLKEYTCQPRAHEEDIKLCELLISECSCTDFFFCIVTKEVEVAYTIQIHKASLMLLPEGGREFESWNNTDRHLLTMFYSWPVVIVELG